MSTVAVSAQTQRVGPELAPLPKTTSSYLGRKIHYPEFGEKIAPEESFWKLVSKISLIAIGIITLPVFGLGMLFLFGAYHMDTKVSPTEEIRRPNNKEIGLGKYHQTHLRLASSSAEGYQWKNRLIASAQESIEFSANFAGGSYFRQTLRLIDERMKGRERLKAHILLSGDLLENEDLELLKQLKASYGERFHYLITPRSINFGLPLHTQENHVKMLIVDGKYVVGGGTGFHPQLCREEPKDEVKENPTYAALSLEKTSKDTDVVLEGQTLASAVRRQFFKLYQLYETGPESRYFALTGPGGTCADFHNADGLIENVRVKFVVGGPEHRQSNAISLTYAKRIARAKEEVRIANWMVHPGPQIREALIDAKNENPAKKITIISNGLPGNLVNGRTPLVLVSRGSYHLADTVYESQTPDQIFHKKVALFDESHMIIGSYNLNKKSDQYDHEVAFVIKDRRVARLGIGSFHTDAQAATKFSRQEIENKRLVHQVGSTIVGFFIENFL